MKRSRTDDNIDISEFNHNQLKILRREIRKREMELWQSQLIKEKIKEKETIMNWKFGKISYKPIDLPDELIKEFGKCIDVAAEFRVGYFTVCYILSKLPKYRINQYGYRELDLFSDGSMHIKIEGNTRDGHSHQYKYSDMIKITFDIHKHERYYNLLTIWRFDKSVFHQGEINLRDRPNACLNDQVVREVGKLEDWNIVFSDDVKVSKERELFTQDLVDFWTNFFDNLFF